MDSWWNVGCEMNRGSYWGNLGSETYFGKLQCNQNILAGEFNALSFLCMFLSDAIPATYLYL